MNDMMNTTLSPKDMAAAIGVSESSVKRWVDAGLIPVVRTAGGHRRIERERALLYICDRGLKVLNPSMLGYNSIVETRSKAGKILLDAGHIYDLLLDGQLDSVRESVVSAFLEGMTVSSLFDTVITPSMVNFSSLIEKDRSGVFIKHRAIQLFVEIVGHLASLCPVPHSTSGLAIGGSPPNEVQILPSQLISAIFRQEHWTTMNLGPQTPLYSFLDIAIQERPRMVWISMDTELSRQQAKGIGNLLQRLTETGAIVVGYGEEALKHRDSWPERVRLFNRMVELQNYIASLDDKDPDLD